MNQFDKNLDNKSKVLILGALGQIGIVLTKELRAIYGNSNVIASDIRHDYLSQLGVGPFEIIDATNYDSILNAIKRNSIDTVYHMAAILSAKAEKKPRKSWDLNMCSLLNVLDLAKNGYVKKIFWPSSIAVFGQSSPKKNVPQFCIMEPTTIYGISKLAGERMCEYYVNNFDIDVRSLRYPGIIGWQSEAGGGTTDYAIDIFHRAINHESFECFLKPGTLLPMIFMVDAINATIKIMNANSSALSIKSSYNLAGISFSPEQIFDKIKRYYPLFSIKYKPDYRQLIADSWPDTIDDSHAKIDFNWKSEYNLDMICDEMIRNLKN